MYSLGSELIHSMIGQVLDRRYQIREFLSEGGFAYTFLAEDNKRPGNPICVVKKLKSSFPDLASLNKARELFNQEAKILQHLGEHSQIPRLLAYFEEEREFYLVQEYIAGNTLKEELIPGQTLTELQVISLVKELLTILKFIYSHNVIHRDIKPSNIIRSEKDNKLVLIDFGAVKQITTEGQQKTIIIGTPGYMPPEQVAGDPNLCSDLYAVGMIGLQALTGVKPQPHFGGGLSSDSQANILKLNNTLISDRLAKILTKMVCCDYQNRYQSPTEALQEIQQLENIVTDAKRFNRKQSTKLTKKALSYSTFFTVTLVGVVIAITLWSSNSSLIKLPLNGELVKSILDRQDVCDMLLENIYCEQYTFKGKSGQQVTIEMNSDTFDPYLVLRAPDGNKLAVNGDISPQNWNAKIVVNLPSNGNYLVMARTSSAGESGSYIIRAEIK